MERVPTTRRVDWSGPHPVRDYARESEESWVSDWSGIGHGSDTDGWRPGPGVIRGLLMAGVMPVASGTTGGTAVLVAHVREIPPLPKDVAWFARGGGPIGAGGAPPFEVALPLKWPDEIASRFPGCSGPTLHALLRSSIAVFASPTGDRLEEALLDSFYGGASWLLPGPGPYYDETRARADGTSLRDAPVPGDFEGRLDPPMPDSARGRPAAAGPLVITRAGHEAPISPGMFSSFEAYTWPGIVSPTPEATETTPRPTPVAFTENHAAKLASIGRALVLLGTDDVPGDGFVLMGVVACLDRDCCVVYFVTDETQVVPILVGADRDLRDHRDTDESAPRHIRESTLHLSIDHFSIENYG